MTRGEREGSDNREGCEEGEREVRREESRSGTINSVQKKSKGIFSHIEAKHCVPSGAHDRGRGGGKERRSVKRPHIN